MGDIDDHALSVHFFNGASAEIAQSAVIFFGASIPQQIAAVVGEVHHPDTELIKHCDISK